MKQEILTHLSTLKDEIIELAKYIHKNPEKSFHEYNCNQYIINLLLKHNFNVKKNYLDMSTAFFAQIGSGHPKICYLCDYDALSLHGDVLGNNLITAMSIGSALGLSKVIPKTTGSVIVIGCPGELMGGSKNIMVKQNTFEDIDVVLQARPYTITAESGTSMAMVPLEIDYQNNLNANKKSSHYSALDACLFTFNGLDNLVKSIPDTCYINGLNITSSNSFNLSHNNVTAKFYLKSHKMSTISEVENKIKDFVKATSNLMNIDYKIHFHELPCDEFIPNKTLSRIFSHNLKESGINHISAPHNTDISLSLGNISKIIPCINPYICITDNPSTKPYTKDFANTTLSDFAIKNILKASAALSLTGFDLIDKQSLLSEAKQELKNYNTI